MTAMEDLLTLQSHDSAVDRLRHRRGSLPERVELAGHLAERGRLDGELAEVGLRRDAELREERRLDDEARRLREKAKEVDAKLYSGTVANPKELAAMQADIDQLRRQASEKEDAELEVMMRREALDAEVAALEGERAVVRGDVDRLEAAIAAACGEIDAELAAEEAARAGAAGGVPGTLLRLYESVRAANRGVGAARLTGATCGACHLSLPATEVDRIRHLDPAEVVRCEHCGAILVR